MILPWSYLALWAQNPWTPTVLGLAFVFQTIRRLHDVGLSGWWFAFAYIGEMTLAITAANASDVALLYLAAGLLPLVALAALALWPGDRAQNRYGPPPGRPVAVAA